MEQASKAGTTLIFMLEGEAELGTTVRRTLVDDELTCESCTDACDLERHVSDPACEVGAVVVSPAALQQGGQEVLARFQEQEPAWSSMPVVLLTPPTGAFHPPLANGVLLQQPVSSRELRSVLRVALGFRARQRELKGLHEHLARVALEDPLTGLPNRSALYERLAELQRERDASDPTPTVIFLDLDDFKSINDTYGHAAGDQALQQVARHLRNSVGDGDFVARFSGDEFIAVLHGADGARRAATAAARLSQGVPVRIGRQSQAVTISASAGILDGVEENASPDTILARADAQMYARKRSSSRPQVSN